MEFHTAGACIDGKVLKQISANQESFMIKRINATEKKFGDMCTSLAAYARGYGKMRDKGDEICRVFQSHGKKEQVACTTALCFQEVAYHFSLVQDHAELAMRRIEEKVIKPLTVYRSECALAREKIRKAYTSRKKELEHRMTLETSRRNGPPMEKNILGQSNTMVGEDEAFERKQLQDLKNVVDDFISIEMWFHAKAVENLSEAMKFVSSINVEADLELFKAFLHPFSPKNLLHLRPPNSTSVESTNRDEKLQINLHSDLGNENEEEEENEDDDDEEQDEDDDVSATNAP